MNYIKIASALILTILINVNMSAYSQDMPYTFNNPIQADISTKRIPAFTILKLRVENPPVNTLNSSEGDQFSATLIEDIVQNNELLLPAGTLVRGNISRIKRSQTLSRGAELTLNFDHIVTPVGKQINVNSNLVNYQNLQPDGSITTGTNYFTVVDTEANKSIDSVVNVTKWGVKKGLSFWKGYPVILTTPTCAIASTAYSGAKFFVKSIVALFEKGDDVIISPGEVLEVKLLDPIDIPIN